MSGGQRVEPKSVQRHRARQHRHALERLQERYWPDATHTELIELRDKVRLLASNLKGVPGTDTKIAFVVHRGQLVKVVYVPRHRAVRTVLPITDPRIAT